MIWTIAKREIVTRARTKGFLIITGLLFVGVLAIAVMQMFLAGSDDPRQVTIGVTGDGLTFAEALEVGNDDLAATTEAVDDGVAQLEQGAIDVLFDGTTLTWEGLPDFTLDTYVRDTVQQATFGQRAEDWA